jgi:hypothetical protein
MNDKSNFLVDLVFKYQKLGLIKSDKNNRFFMLKEPSSVALYNDDELSRVSPAIWQIASPPTPSTVNEMQIFVAS